MYIHTYTCTDTDTVDDVNKSCMTPCRLCCHYSPTVLLCEAISVILSFFWSHIPHITIVPYTPNYLEMILVCNWASMTLIWAAVVVYKYYDQRSGRRQVRSEAR